ncbi:late competence development ComFB family protein [Clostridiaceae bacterium HSG29]|nr:late competence development ComFB family protein [Clostridiaceae bacterium HSG29]
MKVHNYMENAVDKLIEKVLDQYDNICKCEICRNDIKAIALNDLKPHYVAIHKGDLYSKVDEMYIQFEADIFRALVHAIEIVSKNPRHE